MGSKFSADHFVQLLAIDELHDRQSSDWNNQARLQNIDLCIHPGRAVSDFIRRRDAIRAAWRFAGKAAANRREINFRANCGFVHSAKFFEPTKQCLAGGVRKGAFQCGFAGTRRLANDHHIGEDCASGDRCRLHARATPASQKPRNMSIQRDLFHGWRHQRRKIDINKLNAMLMMMQVTIGK